MFEPLPKIINRGTLSGAIQIPVDELRDRVNEIPTDKPLLVLCEEGLRGYIATRILIQRGFEARNLLGGHKLLRSVSSDL
jgi:rhodanese-related sulfurtransferase